MSERLTPKDDFTIVGSKSSLSRIDRLVLRFNTRSPGGFVWGVKNGRHCFFRPYS